MNAAVEPVLLSARRAGWVTAVVIGLLLILRMVVLGLGALLVSPVPTWLDPFFQIATYLLTLFLIFWEHERLEEFHISWLAVGIIVIFKPLETLFLSSLGFGQDHPLAFPRPGALIIWAAALAMLAWLSLARPALRKVNRAEWRWFGLGLLAGVATAVVLSFPMAMQLREMGQNYIPSQAPGLFSLLISALMMHIPYQLGYAAVTEEPLFRGFLWGYLRRLGWWDASIWLFQALLFTLSHIYYINRLPYSFWIVVPVGALVMGWLARRSRSIATSMAAHAALNALGMGFAQIVYFLLFR